MCSSSFYSILSTKPTDPIFQSLLNLSFAIDGFNECLMAIFNGISLISVEFSGGYLCIFSSRESNHIHFPRHFTRFPVVSEKHSLGTDHYFFYRGVTSFRICRRFFPRKKRVSNNFFSLHFVMKTSFKTILKNMKALLYFLLRKEKHFLCIHTHESLI